MLSGIQPIFMARPTPPIPTFPHKRGKEFLASASGNRSAPPTFPHKRGKEFLRFAALKAGLMYLYIIIVLHSHGLCRKLYLPLPARRDKPLYGLVRLHHMPYLPFPGPKGYFSALERFRFKSSAMSCINYHGRVKR